MHKLVIQDDEGKTTVVPLIREEITIGRKEGNTIRLTERNVSRRHARITRGNGAITIEDLDSYNGVRVNGSRIQGRCSLAVSDRVQIGDYLIELKAEGAEESDPYSDQKTQPIERIENMVTTPVNGAGGNGAGGNGAVAVIAPDQPTVPAPRPHMPEAAAVADTDPGSAAVATAPAAAPQPVGLARMVVLSANFAGREFELNKPAMVIGRTDDNDIVVNHRSISRHHAKIVQENGRHAIVDLQSSNGVRVNGEEYGKVELRRGDVIDLGHVRMRFVEAGEDFVFGRDAHAVDIGPSGSRGMIWALVVLLLIGGSVGIYLATRGGSSSSSVAGGSDTPVAVPETPPAIAIDAAAAPAVDDTDPVAVELREHLAAATSAIDAEKWADASAAAARALAVDPANAEAKRVQQQSTRELANEERFAALGAAVGVKEYAKVAELFGAIEQDSVYRDRARDQHDALKQEYVGSTEARARQLLAQRKCRDLRRLAANAGAVWPEAGQAAGAQAAQCEQLVRADQEDKPPRDRPPRDKPPRDDEDLSGSAGKTAAQLLDEAKQAAKAEQFGRASKLCAQALAKKPGDQQAVMVCAIAACNLKSASKARRYLAQMRSADSKMIARQICLRNGVKI